MYATCLHCHHALGTNESIEAFPVGRRLAFDSAKGRLWVICPSCERWNLSPIEERWEAVESCERVFRGRKLRAQTDNVGLTRLAEGTELIRIGSPLRPEFAAWRYGEVFRRRLERRRNAMFMGGGAVVGAAMGLSGMSLVGAVALSVAPGIALPVVHAGIVAMILRGRLNGTRIAGEDGKPLSVNRGNLDHTRVIVRPDEPIALYVQHSYGHQTLTGERATRALGAILTSVNRGGGRSGTVHDAAELIADAGDPVRAIARVAGEAERRAGNFEELAAESVRAIRSKTIGETLDAQLRLQAKIRATYGWGLSTNGLPLSNPGALHRLPRVYRLALEMALHESSEQRALDEELEHLERAWREAEEIAAIADNLLTPREITASIEKAKSSK